MTRKSRNGLFPLITQPKVKVPSDNEAFQIDLKLWLDDEFYAQQALAGINPMTLERVSNHGGMALNRVLEYNHSIFSLSSCYSSIYISDSIVQKKMIL